MPLSKPRLLSQIILIPLLTMGLSSCQSTPLTEPATEAEKEETHHITPRYNPPASIDSQSVNAAMNAFSTQLNTVTRNPKLAQQSLSLSWDLFETDAVALNAGGIQAMTALTNVLQRHPQQQIQIETRINNGKSTAYRQGLAERFAQIIRLALITNGIASNRILIKGEASQTERLLRITFL